MGKLSNTFALSIGALALVSAGCTTEPTYVTDVWKDPSYTAGPMKNIVIFGAKLNETNRHTLEDGFVTALAGRSVRATQSYKVLPSPPPPKDAARSMLEQGGFDGILVATLKSVKDAVAVVGSDFWSDYYGTAWGDEYAVNEPIVKFETTVWDPTNGKVVWSAVTQTDNPTSGKDFTKSLTSEVVPKLQQAQLISPPSGQPISYAPAPSMR